jgi:cobalamin biosynthesis protein CbiG
VDSGQWTAYDVRSRARVATIESRNRPNLWIGIGCKRGTISAEIAMAIDAVIAEYDLDRQSIVGIATIDFKLGEVGLVEYCQNQNLKSIGYSAELLNSIASAAASERVKQFIGTASVAEAAALWAAQSDRLTVPKQKFRFDSGGAVTIAIAQSQ